MIPGSPRAPGLPLVLLRSPRGELIVFGDACAFDNGTPQAGRARRFDARDVGA